MVIIKITMITILTNLGVCALWSPTEPSRVGATDFEKLETSNASSSCSTGATSDQISDRGGFWTLFNEQDKKSKSIFNPATLKTQNDEWLFSTKGHPATLLPTFGSTGQVAKNLPLSLSLSLSLSGQSLVFCWWTPIGKECSPPCFPMDQMQEIQQGLSSKSSVMTFTKK